jgi:hypothetical protein
MMTVAVIRLARPTKKSGIFVALAILIALICSACGGKVSPNLSYKAPAFLPFHISIGKQGGNPTISGNASWITELGVFSVGAQYELPPSVPGFIRVIVRDRRTGFDRVYQVRTNGDQFAAVVNGTTTISVSQDQVLIDVTNGKIQQITFKRVKTQIAEGKSGIGWWHTVTTRWDEGWARSWYKPFMLSGWAYNDSTVTKWYGVGFLWFLIRFLFACILGVLDLIFTILFFFGQFMVTIFGNSVWPGGLG